MKVVLVIEVEVTAPVRDPVALAVQVVTTQGFTVREARAEE